MRLALLAEAETELDDAAAWYNDRSEGLGDEFVGVAREALTFGGCRCIGLGERVDHDQTFDAH